MKNYIEITDELFERRDLYLEKQKKKRTAIIKITSVACSLMLVCAIGIGVWQAGPFDSKDLDEGVAAPEIFPQQQEGENQTDQTPEQNTGNADNTLQSTVPSDNKEPQQSTQVQDPGQNTDNNTESKEPDVSLEAITPSLKGDMTQNFSPAIKYKPLEFEIDDDFSPYEVVVTLTQEESVEGKRYSVSDFPEFDIYNVFEYSDYYSDWDYPEIKDCTSIFLMLSEPSKERVLEYCKLLEKDERVLFARPNINEYAYKYAVLKAVFTDEIVNTENYQELMNNAIEDIKKNLDLFSVHLEDQRINKYRGEIYFELCGSPNNYDYLSKQIKILVDSGYFEYVRPLYNVIDESYILLIPHDEYLSVAPEFNISDFPEIEVAQVKYFDYNNSVGLYFATKDKKYALDAYQALKNNKYAKNIEFSDHVEIYMLSTTS